MLIPFAHADAAAAQQPSLLMQLLPLVVIFVLFYFLLIRPQQQKMKEHKAMLDALQKGDEVVTAGGTLGRVVKVGDAYLTLEVADGVEVVVQRTAVAQKLEKGTLKAQR
jgi:preprotein translocase subunit YajC